MNIYKSGDVDTLQQRKFVVCALLMFVSLTFAFFNTLGVGFTSARAPALLAWLGASVVAICFVSFEKKEKTNWAALIFFSIFVFILIRQGPKPIHATALALIVLTMACVAHSATFFVRDSRLVLVFASTVVWVAILNALVALYQYFGLSVQYPIPYVQIAPEGMAIGQVRQPNQMAILCVLGLVTLAYFPFKFRWVGVARIALGLCLIAAVAASASRIGAVAMLLFASTLVFTFRSVNKATKQFVGFSFPVFLICVYLVHLLAEDKAGLLSRLTDDAFSIPCNSRRLLWTNALSLIWQAPWAGAGWGGFIGEYYAADLPFRGCEMIDHAHNVYLQIAVEAGLPAALLVIFVSAWFFIKHWRVVETDGIYRWAYLAVAVIWLYSQTDFPLWETGFLWLFTIFLGIIASRESSDAMASVGSRGSRLWLAVNPRLIVLVALATASLSAMALMQFFRVSSIETYADWEKQIAKSGYQALVKENWMFTPRLEFIVAEFQRPTVENAEKINKFCKSVMTYSPDGPIIMCVIRSAYLMGDMKQVEFHKQRLLTIYGSKVDMYKEELESYK